MARRRQRYSRLFDKLRAQGGQVPTGTGEIAGFYDFLLGKEGSKIVQTNKIPAEARKRYKVGLIPFGVSATDTTVENRYIGYISAYSLKALKSTRVNANENDFGHFPSDEGGEEENNYFPALLKATYSRSGAVTDPDKISAVTGQPYSYTPKRTFSFPFGRTTTNTSDAKTGATETTLNNVDELDVLKSLTEKLKAGTSDASKPSSISYDPELFREVVGSEADTTATLTEANLGTFDID